jgi:HD-GYP domain-containing protein (c-di-GMP phosphodiesterase class II)
MVPEDKIKDLEQQIRKYHNAISEFSALFYSIEMVNSTIDLHVVLDHLMELAKNIADCEAASALLLEDDRLCFVAASGVKSAEIKKIYLNKGEGIAGWVIEQRKPLVISDVANDARFSNRVDNSSGFVTRSILAVPLKVEDKVIGVVEAVNKKGGNQFNENDERLLSSLATSAAMAINKAQLYGDLNDLFFSTIKALANAIEAKDLYTRGHSERIRDFSLIIAKEMGVPQNDLKDIELAALLHDVGKIGVSEAVLQKEGKLTDDEFREIKKHPVVGAEILSSIKQLKAALPGIRYHQERYDGKGYPEGLSGECIPLFARIIAVADTFDAMTSDRPYRKALPDQTALGEIERCAGAQFDTVCVKAFMKGYEKGLIKSQGNARKEKSTQSQGNQDSAGLNV